MSEGANAGEATAAVAEGEAISENYVDAEGKAHLSSEFSDLNEEYSGLKEGQSPKGKVGFTDESTGTTYVSETYNHDKLVEDEEKSLDPAGVGLNLDKFSPGERVNTEETERIYKDIFDISPEVASETAKTFKKNQEGEPNIRPTADSEDLGASKNPDHDKSLKIYKSDTTVEEDVARGAYKLLTGKDATLSDKLDEKNPVDEAVGSEWYAGKDSKIGNGLERVIGMHGITDQTVGGKVVIDRRLTKREEEAVQRELDRKYDEDGDYKNSPRAWRKNVPTVRLYDESKDYDPVPEHPVDRLKYKLENILTAARTDFPEGLKIYGRRISGARKQAIRQNNLTDALIDTQIGNGISIPIVKHYNGSDEQIGDDVVPQTVRRMGVRAKDDSEKYKWKHGYERGTDKMREDIKREYARGRDDMTIVAHSQAGFQAMKMARESDQRDLRGVGKIVVMGAVPGGTPSEDCALGFYEQNFKGSEHQAPWKGSPDSEANLRGEGHIRDYPIIAYLGDDPVISTRNARGGRDVDMSGVVIKKVESSPGYLHDTGHIPTEAYTMAVMLDALPQFNTSQKLPSQLRIDNNGKAGKFEAPDYMVRKAA